MEARDHNHLLVMKAIEDAVREPTKEGSASVAVDQRVKPGVCDHQLERRLYGDEILVPEPNALPFVPREGLLDVGRRGRPKERRLQRP